MNTIELSREEKFSKKIVYYLTSASKEQCDKLTEIEASNNKELYYEEFKKLVNNENAIPIMVGDGMQLMSHRIEPILGKIGKTKFSTGQFRCYDIPLEQQEKIMSNIELCADTKTCWQSALRAVGYRQASGLRTPAYYTAYALLWKEVG